MTRECIRCNSIFVSSGMFCHKCSEISPVLESSASWVHDKIRGACASPGCDKKFTLTNRRHHCRQCGDIFCSPCTQKSLPYPPRGKRERVCIKCYAGNQFERLKNIDLRNNIYARKITKFFRSIGLPLSAPSSVGTHGVDPDLEAALLASMQESLDVRMMTRKKMRLWSYFCSPGVVQQYNHNCAYNTLRMLCEHRQVEYRDIGLNVSNLEIQMITLNQAMINVLRSAYSARTRRSLVKLFSNCIYLNCRDARDYLSGGFGPVCNDLARQLNLNVFKFSAIVCSNDHYKFVYFDHSSQCFVIRDAALGMTKDEQSRVYMNKLDQPFSGSISAFLSLVEEVDDIHLYLNGYMPHRMEFICSMIDQKFSAMPGYIPGAFLSKGFSA